MAERIEQSGTVLNKYSIYGMDNRNERKKK